MMRTNRRGLETLKRHKEHSLTIAAIADDLGYSDQAHSQGCSGVGRAFAESFPGNGVS